MFEAVYISDNQNNLIFEYLISLQSPHFKSLINIIKSKQDDNNDTLNNSPLIQINSEFYVCCHNASNIIIYLLCSKNDENQTNPILPFVFVNRLIEVMEDYFGIPLAITKIDANNDTLTLLINNMIDDGIPNITDFNKLRDLIPFKSLLSRFLSSSNELTKSITPTKNSVPTFASSSNDIDSIPWRRDNVKYTNNEMYVDVVETINVILKPHHTNNFKNDKKFDSAFYSTSSFSNQTKLVPIMGSINGEINFLSHLTGVPYLQMLLNVRGLNLEIPQFHPCIKIDKWMDQEGNLSFIPPDGNSTLMTYQVDLENFNKKVQQEMLGLLDIDYQVELGPLKNEFEIKILLKSHKSVSKLENLIIEVNSSSLINDLTSDSNILNVKSNRLTHGDFQYKGNGKAEWNLRNLANGIQPILRGSIITNSSDDFNSSSASSLNENLIEIENSNLVKPIKPNYIKISYSNKGCVPSGLKVDSLKILSAKGLGETVKPYKGVKYITRTGDYIIRS